MKLLYRGLSYEYTPGTTIGRSETDYPVIGNPYSLIYRGSSYTVYPGLESRDLAPQPIACLTYRGETYSLNGGQAAQPRLSKRIDRVTEVSRIHNDNIHRDVQRRLAAAQAQGNQALVSVLEKELQQTA
ncbi:MAG TPA: DUF4278 domain-containing protein [Thermosynechococcaceae cyanobacterium]